MDADWEYQMHVAVSSIVISSRINPHQPLPAKDFLITKFASYRDNLNSSMAIELSPVDNGTLD